MPKIFYDILIILDWSNSKSFLVFSSLSFQKRLARTIDAVEFIPALKQSTEETISAAAGLPCLSSFLGDATTALWESSQILPNCPHIMSSSLSDGPRTSVDRGILGGWQCPKSKGKCTLLGSRLSPGYGKTGRMAGTGQGGRFSLSGRYCAIEKGTDLMYLNM